MRHGIRLPAQFQQRACDTSGNVQECQIAGFTGGFAEAVGHLTENMKQQAGFLFDQFLKFHIADFGDFTFGLGFDPGGAFFVIFVKQPHLAEKIAVIQIGHDHFTAIFIFDDD